MNVLNGMHTFDGFFPEFIRRTDGVSGINAAAGEQHGHGLRVVISTESLATTAFPVVWTATELSGPHHQCLVQHVALF